MNPPEKILVVVLRRIGDVLLTTPLIRSMHRAWPKAAIDVLVFHGTEGVIEANPDIHSILTVREGAPLKDQLDVLFRIMRTYDLSISVQPSDRPTFYAWAAGRTCVGTLDAGLKESWKGLLLSRWVPFDNVCTHTVAMNLRLAELLGIGKACDVVVSWRPSDEGTVTELLGFTPEEKPFAVLHPFPKFNYKQWRRSGWTELGRWLSSRGLRVVLSGGSSNNEKMYVDDIARQLPSETINLAGRLRLSGTGFLISRARVYVGPDTVLTHMSAALGVPTVALFGPTNPVKWGPWPKGYCGDTSPYVMKGSQRAGNVMLIQGGKECEPCREEGCDRNIESFSRCLVEISDDRVIAAVEEALSLAGAPAA